MPTTPAPADAPGMDGAPGTLVRVALSQLPTRVGDLDGNTARLTAAIGWAQAAGADLHAVPEMALTGYPAEDLLAEPAFLDATAAALSRVAAATAAGGTHLVGAPLRVRDLPEAGGARDQAYGLDAHTRELRNAAAVLAGGRLTGAYAKQLLPTYSVFDDARHFGPGRPTQAHLRLSTPTGPVVVAVMVCEDVWDPALVCAFTAGAQLLVVLNASPYQVGKPAAREDLLADLARTAGIPVAYVNSCGGQDDVVFDGHSVILDEHGTVLARAAAFTTDRLLVDVPVPPARPGAARELLPTPGRPAAAAPTAPVPATTPPALGTDDEAVYAQVYQALVTGFGDYCRRVGAPGVVLGLSGGIDSALTATIAVDALGPDKVHGLAMPGPYSSPGSVTDALDLAARLGVRCDTVPIAGGYTERRGTLEALVTDVAATHGRAVNPVTWENLQARLRGLTLMALANATGALVVATGNRSESAVGYFTLYGDSCGTAPNPLGDLLKTDVRSTERGLLPGVYGLAAWRNRLAQARGELAPIPVSTLTKAPSAELADGQVDADSLPPYPVLDTLLAAFLDDNLTPDACVDLLAEQFALTPAQAEATVRRVFGLLDRSEFKRRQVPLRIKVSPRAFGRDRRMPLASAWRHAPTPAAARDGVPA